MAQAALAEKTVTSALRRFELPDLDRHPWIFDRLQKGLPHLTTQNLIGFIRGIMYEPNFIFQFQPNACGLAYAAKESPLAPKEVLREIFVWARNPQDKQHVAEAAEIYGAFATFAVNKNIDVAIVAEASDVPPEMIGQAMGNVRLFDRVQKFVKVS